MSSPTHSDILQDNAKILEKQQQEMQWRHEKEQWLLVQLKEVAKLHQAECMAQKTRREAKEKAKEEAERQRVAEEKERKKRIVEYLQQLWNKVIAEGAEGFQVTRSKHRKVFLEDGIDHWPSKKG